jgi:energy-coupling factor transporter ATP-binding protein EcfA2
MPYDIIIGRDEEKKRELGTKASVYLGKQYVKMGQTTAMSNNLYLDVSTSHVVLVCGKRGTGKSTTLGVIAEGIAKQPEEIKENLSVLILDTLGIFWSMKYPNLRQEKLLQEWGLKPESLGVKVYTPKGKFQEYKKRGIPVDFSFSLKPGDMSAEDWTMLFNIDFLSPAGVLISRVIGENPMNSFQKIIAEIKKDKKSDVHTRETAEGLFKTAASWGVFDEKGSELEDILKPGQISILDLSCYSDWNIKTMVMGVLGKKLLQQRMEIRKMEEMNMISREKDYFDIREDEKKMPLVWVLLDEGHEFLPKDKITPATGALVQILREGRQPGITMVIATQQPGEIDKDVITQSDIVVSHRLTAKVDITALENIMQSYLSGSISGYLNNLPQWKGSAIILDDNSERIYPMRVHPKQSWHGGEAPNALKEEKPFLDLGL